MLPKNKRICPCCGKKLELVPPTKELLPKRTLSTIGGREFYLISKKRILSYTISPKSNFTYPAGFDNYSPATVKEDYCFINKGSTRNEFTGIATTYNTQKKLSKDNLRLFSWEMVFHCSNCGQKLALNYNPFTILNDCLWLSLICLIFLIFFCMTGFAAIWAFNSAATFAVFCVMSGICPLFIIFSFFGLAYAKLFLSNFVPTNEVDNLIHPPTDIKLSTSLRSPYLREGNVLAAKLADGEVHIYLVHKNGNYEFSICCEDGEREQLKNRISEYTELELTFEGKPVGKAEVVQ
ncbi:MAG: hypothetical protein HDT43_10815 [Ruminococcaceae bacterium]|nr:hypothetical protein [Oscillospiraceae bacterium]